MKAHGRERGGAISNIEDMRVGFFTVYLFYGSHPPSEWMIEQQNLMFPELQVTVFAQKNLTTLSH
jgi:hypothetical protein